MTYNQKKGTNNIFAGCTIILRSMKQCARCKAVHYCGRTFQLWHWPLHKKVCRSTKKNNDDVHADTCINSGTGGASHLQHGKGKRQEAFVDRTLDGEERSICLELVVNESNLCLELVVDESNFQLPCGHWYHNQCVKELRLYGVSDSCPNCREPLSPGLVEAINNAVRLLVKAT